MTVVRYQLHTYRCPSCETFIDRHSSIHVYVEPPIRNCPKCDREIVVSTCNEWELLAEHERGQYWAGLFSGVVYAPWPVFLLTTAITTALVIYFGGSRFEEAILPGAIVGGVCVLLWWPFIVWRFLRPIRASRRRMEDPAYRARIEAASGSGKAAPSQMHSRDGGEPFAAAPEAAGFGESQGRVRQGMLLMLAAMAIDTMTTVVLPAMSAELPSFAWQLVRWAGYGVILAFMGGCFLCLREAEQPWSKRFLAAALILFGLCLLVSFGIGVGLTVVAFACWMFYLLAEERGESFGLKDSERGYMIPAGIFVLGVLFTIGALRVHVDDVNARAGWLLLVPYAFAALMTYVRLPGKDSPTANR